MPAILAVLALLIPAAVHAAPTTPRDLVTERAVLVMRLGIRAPLNGEVPEGPHRSALAGLARSAKRRHAGWRTSAGDRRRKGPPPVL